MNMERDNTTLKVKKKIPLTQTQINLLSKEKGRADFDDNYHMSAQISLNKTGLRFAYACHFEQTRYAFMTHGNNAIVIIDTNGNYDLF